MKNEKDLSRKLPLVAQEESITDSFPLMVIMCLFFVVTIMHLFIVPMAMSFANKLVY